MRTIQKHSLWRNICVALCCYIIATTNAFAQTSKDTVVSQPITQTKSVTPATSARLISISNKLIATNIDNNRRKYDGLMFGLDLGASFGLPVDTWRDIDGSTVSGIPSPGDVVNPYIRLTIGGGGFRKHMPVQ